ncbi:MAG: FtsX-like permease family protein [Candidatus Odinarchaeota archaeon]
MLTISTIIFNFRQLVHAKKQESRLVLGITVALVVILSINLGISTSQQDTFQQVIDNKVFDFTLRSTLPLEATSIQKTLKEGYGMPVMNVSGIKVFGSQETIGDNTWLSTNASNNVLHTEFDVSSVPITYSVSNNYFKHFIDREVITELPSDYNLTGNRVLVDDYTAQTFNLETGSTIYLHNQLMSINVTEQVFVNYSVQLEIGGIFKLNRNSTKYLELLYPVADVNELPSWLSYSSPFLIIDYLYFPEMITSLNPALTTEDIGFTYFVLFLDRPEAIVSYDVLGSLESLNYLEKRFEIILRQEFSDSGFSVYNTLSFYLRENQEELEFIRILLLVVSLPAIIISFHFSRLTSQLSTKEREGDIGILKSRGATPRQINYLFITEGFLVGMFSGIIAMPCTVFFTCFLFDTPLSKLLSILFPADNPSVHVWVFIAIPIIAGGILGVAVNWQSARDATRMNILTSLQKMPFGTAQQMNHKNEKPLVWPFIVTVIAILPILTLFLDQWFLSNFFQPFQYLFDLSNVIGAVVAPLLPFILPWAFVRILSSKLGSLSGLIQQLVRPLLRDASVLVKQSFKHNIRIGVQLAFITSMALAFTILPLFLGHNLQIFAASSLEAEIGGDLMLQGPLNQVNQTSEERIRNILPTESSITSAFFVGTDYLGNRLTLAGINSSSYTDVVRLKSFNAYDTESLRELTGKLDNLAENEAIIDNTLAEEEGFLIDDRIFIEIIALTRTSGLIKRINLNFTIVGIKSLLPGIDSPDTQGSLGKVGVIINSSVIIPLIKNYKFLSLYQPVCRYLVRLPPEIRSSSFAISMQQAFGYDVSVRNLQGEIEKTQNPTLASIDVIKALEGQSLLVAVILVLDVTVVVSLTLRDREREFGLYRSRGIQTRQLFILIFAQVLTLALTGAILGMLAGWISGFLLINNTLALFNPTEVPIPSNFPLLGLLIATGTVIAFFAVTLAGQIWLQKKPIIEQIRVVNR